MTEECWSWWVVWQSMSWGWLGYIWGNQQKAEARNFDYAAWRKMSSPGKTEGVWWGCFKAVTPKSSRPGTPQFLEGPWHGILEDKEGQTQVWDDCLVREAQPFWASFIPACSLPRVSARLSVSVSECVVPKISELSSPLL